MLGIILFIHPNKIDDLFYIFQLTLLNDDATCSYSHRLNQARWCSEGTELDVKLEQRTAQAKLVKGHRRCCHAD